MLRCGIDDKAFGEDFDNADDTVLCGEPSTQFILFRMNDDCWWLLCRCGEHSFSTKRRLRYDGQFLTEDEYHATVAAVIVLLS